jgi:hypothetical protein
VDLGGEILVGGVIDVAEVRFDGVLTRLGVGRCFTEEFGDLGVDLR